MQENAELFAGKFETSSSSLLSSSLSSFTTLPYISLPSASSTLSSSSSHLSSYSSPLDPSYDLIQPSQTLTSPHHLQSLFSSPTPSHFIPSLYPLQSMQQYDSAYNTIPNDLHHYTNLNHASNYIQQDKNQFKSFQPTSFQPVEDIALQDNYYLTNYNNDLCLNNNLYNNNKLYGFIEFRSNVQNAKNSLV